MKRRVMMVVKEKSGFDSMVSVRFEAGTCEDVDDGGVRSEIVVTEGFGIGPLEEVKSEVGFVFEVESDLGEVGRVDAVRVEGMKSVPAGF